MLAILYTVASNPFYLFLAWVLTLILWVSWSGMAKFLTLIFFPGRIIHVATHNIIARRMGWQLYVVMKIDWATEQYSLSYITKNPNFVIVTIAPAIPALALIGILQTLLSSRYNFLLAWLIVSMAITGLPDKNDISILAQYVLLENAYLLAIGLAWTIIPLTLGNMCCGTPAGFLGAALYLTILLLTYRKSLTPQTQIIIE